MNAKSQYNLPLMISPHDMPRRGILSYRLFVPCLCAIGLAMISACRQTANEGTGASSDPVTSMPARKTTFDVVALFDWEQPIEYVYCPHNEEIAKEDVGKSLLVRTVVLKPGEDRYTGLLALFRHLDAEYDNGSYNKLLVSSIDYSKPDHDGSVIRQRLNGKTVQIHLRGGGLLVRRNEKGELMCYGVDSTLTYVLRLLRLPENDTFEAAYTRPSH